MEDKHGGAHNCALPAANTNHHAYYNQEYDSKDASRQWEAVKLVVKVCACCAGGYCSCRNSVE